MTYNIQHGLDAAGRYRLQGAIDVISRLQPDLVGLQEVTRNHPAYNCDDQPERLRNGLQQATGRPWTVDRLPIWIAALSLPKSARW